MHCHIMIGMFVATLQNQAVPLTDDHWRHLVTCPNCQAALSELAVRNRPEVPLVLRALTERHCNAMIADIAACAEAPSEAARRYPVSRAHIALCPDCRAVYSDVRTMLESSSSLVVTGAAQAPQQRKLHEQRAQYETAKSACADERKACDSHS